MLISFFNVFLTLFADASMESAPLYEVVTEEMAISQAAYTELAAGNRSRAMELFRQAVEIGSARALWNLASRVETDEREILLQKARAMHFTDAIADRFSHQWRRELSDQEWFDLAYDVGSVIRSGDLSTSIALARSALRSGETDRLEVALFWLYFSRATGEICNRDVTGVTEVIVTVEKLLSDPKKTSLRWDANVRAEELQSLCDRVAGRDPVDRPRY